MTTITATTPTLDFQGSNTHLKDYFDILLRRKWIVLTFCIVSTLVVTILNLMMTPLYKASTTIVIESENSVLNPADTGSRGMSFEIFDNYVETQKSLILSRSVAGKVFEDLKLDQQERYQGEPDSLKVFLNNKISELFSLFSPEEREKPAGPIDPLPYFLKDIQIMRIKGTRAIQITVYNPDPILAAEIANKLAERYSRDNLMRRALTFIRNQRMSSLNADYLRLQSKYDELSNQYGPKHHKMIALMQEIRALASRIEAEQHAKAQESSPDAFEDLSKEEEEQLLENILHQIQESSILSSSQMNNIAVADPAVPSSDIARPQKKRNVMIAFLASFVVGIFLAFFVEYLDDTIKSEDDLKKAIGSGVNFMGLIPFDDHAKGFRKISKLDRLVMNRPLSGSAEAYRLLRIQLQWFVKKNGEVKDFAICSSIPDEGKTTIASNLAISLSQLNQKVLLVDSDIRRGRLYRTFGTGKKRGLAQYLSEDMPLEKIIQQTKIPNLWIVTPGENVILGVSELFSSPKMSEFIQETRKYFDIVVYDTPPITLVADASVLMSQLHGAILVSRTGVTRSRLIQKSLSMIRGSNTSLIGLVLNSSYAAENNKYYHRYYRD